MNPITPEWEPELRKLLQDSSYSIIENALEKLSFQFPANTKKYLDITKNEKGVVGNNVRIKWLELACGLENREQYLNELVAYACPPYEFRTRINAMEALKKLNYFDEKVLEGLLASASHFNTRLASPAEQNLIYYYKQSSFKKMITDFASKPTLSTSQRQTLRRIMR
jgi:hypothetical protein